SDISNIQQGASVELNVNGSIHEGRVDFIEKSFDDFYTVRVYLQCDDHESLRIGTLVKGYLTAKKRKSNTLWVPTAAVLYLGNSRSAVFVKKELGYQATAVRVGSQTTEWVEIIGGLSVQDSIAPVAAYLVDSEAFINTDNVQ
ncbi:MAG TPA: hypothetical protein VL947_00080, partial [Cytophagales bacterium]|nr:hypothetical protein [Cytophagales bacterium]